MAKKFYTHIDLNKNQLQNVALQQLASDPSSPVQGQVYFNTTYKQIKYYTGVSWVILPNENVFSVRSYGAVGDGATDDTAAFQAAMTAAALVKGSVYIPRSISNYMVNPVIGLAGPSSVLVFGDGFGSVIQVPANTNADGNLLRFESKTNIQLRDFVLDGNKSNQTSGSNYGLYIASSSDSIVSNVVTRNFTGVGNHVYNCTNVVVSQCLSTGNGYHGYEAEQTRNCVWYGNRGHDNSRHGIFISPGEVGGTGATGNSFVGNLFTSNGQYGIAAGQDAGGLSTFLSTDNVISGNIVRSNAEYGISLYKVNGFTVNNNEIGSNGKFGIYIYQGSYHQVTVNKLHNNSQSSNGSYDEILLEGATDGHASVSNVIAHNMIVIDGGTKARYAISEANNGDGPNRIVDNVIPYAGTSGRLHVLNANSSVDAIDLTTAQTVAGIKTFSSGVVISPNATLPGGVMGFDAPFGNAALRTFSDVGNLQYVAPNGNADWFIGGNNVLSATNSYVTLHGYKLQEIANGTATADAINVGQVNAKLGYVSVKDYGATGNGSTDDTQAIKDALDAANTASSAVFFPPGRYRCGVIYRAYAPRIVMHPGTVTILATNSTDQTWNFGATSLYGSPISLSTDLAAGSTALQIPTTGITAGDYLFIRHTQKDFAPSAPEEAMIARVISVDSGTQVTLNEPAYVTFLTSASATAQLLPGNGTDGLQTTYTGAYIHGVRFESVAGVANGGGFIRLYYMRNAHVEMEGKNAGGPGLIYESCYQFSGHAKILQNYDVTGPGGFAGQFGYGVDISGASAHGIVEAIVDRARHAVAFVGTARDVVVRGVGTACTSTTWDAHYGATDIVFADCQAYGGLGFAFALRGKRQHVHGGIADRTYGGVFVFDAPGQNEIKDLRLSNLANNGDTNTGNGILISNPMDGLTISNVDITATARNGICFRQGSGVINNVRVVNNRIRNVGQQGTTNEQAGVRVITTANLNNAVFSNNIFEDDQITPTTAAAFHFNPNTANTEVDIENNHYRNNIVPYLGSGVSGKARIGFEHKTFGRGNHVLATTFSAIPAFDTSLAAVQSITLTADVTSSTFANPVDGRQFTLVVIQDGTGGHAFNFPANVTWQNASLQVGQLANQASIATFTYSATLSKWLCVNTSKIAGGSITVGLFSARPAANLVAAGDRYFATDTNVEYISNGTTWYQTAGATATVVDVYSNRPAASGGNAGTRFFATDTGEEFYSDGTNWYTIGVNENNLFGGHTVALGETLLPRFNANNNIAVTSGEARISCFTAKKTEVTNNIRVNVAVASSGTAPTLCKMAVYSIDGSGNLTRVATTANDTTMFSVTGGKTVPLAASFTRIRGQRYAVLDLIISTGTLPQFIGTGLNAAEGAVAPIMNGRVTSQTDLLASYTSGQVGTTTNFVQHYLLP